MEESAQPVGGAKRPPPGSLPRRESQSTLPGTPSTPIARGWVGPSRTKVGWPGKGADPTRKRIKTPRNGPSPAIQVGDPPSERGVAPPVGRGWTGVENGVNCLRQPSRLPRPANPASPARDDRTAGSARERWLGGPVSTPAHSSSRARVEPHPPGLEFYHPPWRRKPAQ